MFLPKDDWLIIRAGTPRALRMRMRARVCSTLVAFHPRARARVSVFQHVLGMRVCARARVHDLEEMGATVECRG